MSGINKLCDDQIYQSLHPNALVITTVALVFSNIIFNMIAIPDSVVSISFAKPALSPTYPIGKKPNLPFRLIEGYCLECSVFEALKLT
jgi:hypothetical protein